MGSRDQHKQERKTLGGVEPILGEETTEVKLLLIDLGKRRSCSPKTR